MADKWVDSIATRRHVIHLHEDLYSLVEPFVKLRAKALGNFLDDIYTILTAIYPDSHTDNLIHVWVKYNSSPHYIEGRPYEMYMHRLTGHGTEAVHEACHIALERAGVPNDIIGTDIINGSRHHSMMNNEGLMKKVQTYYYRKRGLLKTLWFFNAIHLR